jgi:hypothetical protein
MAVVVCKHAATSGEVWIERRVMLIDFVAVAACGVRLPDFDERTADWQPILVEHAPMHDDALTQRICSVLRCQVRI